MPTKSERYINIRLSEEAKIAVEIIRQYHMPGTQQQEILSMAVTEFLHAYHPELEALVQQAIVMRKDARRHRTEHEALTDDQPKMPPRNS